jgi:hypothetical protein
MIHGTQSGCLMQPEECQVLQTTWLVNDCGCANCKGSYLEYILMIYGTRSGLLEPEECQVLQAVLLVNDRAHCRVTTLPGVA